jgi:hypothetical protein
MPAPAMPVARRSALGDLLRLAVPLVLIAGAVAAALWIDRGASLGGSEATGESAVASH